MSVLSAFRFLPLALVLLVFAFGCQVGEDDPSISFRSRDARLKGTWELRQMQTETVIYQFNQGRNPEENRVTTSYDGRNLTARARLGTTIDLDTTLGFGYMVDIQDRGKTAYAATLVQNGLGVRSGTEDRWYWLHDDRRKSRVFLGNLLRATQVLSIIPGDLASISDFEVKELRNDVLRLTFHRRAEQTGLDGNTTETLTSGELEFRPQ